MHSTMINVDTLGSFMSLWRHRDNRSAIVSCYNLDVYVKEHDILRNTQMIQPIINPQTILIRYPHENAHFTH